jgi:hypothetical protein
LFIAFLYSVKSANYQGRIFYILVMYSWYKFIVFSWIWSSFVILRSKVKVPRRSLWYVTHPLMVMHPHTKYHWPISKETIIWSWGQSSRSQEGHYGTRHTASYCSPLASVVCTLLDFNLLLSNHLTNWNRAWYECSLNGFLQNLCCCFKRGHSLKSVIQLWRYKSGTQLWWRL